MRKTRSQLLEVWASLLITVRVDVSYFWCCAYSGKEHKIQFEKHEKHVVILGVALYYPVQWSIESTIVCALRQFLRFSTRILKRFFLTWSDSGSSISETDNPVFLKRRRYWNICLVTLLRKSSISSGLLYRRFPLHS